ncbi:mechanosensitive ion channel [Thalassotalea ponticola]|uniref:mechanosensitive ion channel domain-containing protein n=1 Tax=Thalassotalea ponticola TaxID=1523392 RepID=UPI0025B3484D|nr:mechanosensitive ion channel domain-containing protein [Thalassotalea ponticola]MDN3652957.1 mechanosensitive ion channel [Thalassotalea ponticola]
MLSVAQASNADAQDANVEQKLQQTLTEIADYQELIEQIETERDDTLGYQKRALAKQRQSTLTRYRNLLLQYLDEVYANKDQPFIKSYRQSARELVEKALVDIYADIDSSDKSVRELEEKIATARQSIFTVNAGPAKDRVEQMNWRLNLARRYQEELYYALVYLTKKSAFLDVDNQRPLLLAKERVRKQADTLAGLIGLNEDKLMKLQKQKAVVRTESETGKKLISQTALLNLEIQEYANRLQQQVTLLEDLDLSAALYKKTVIQARNTLSEEVLDGQVLAHLVTEWWINFKTWLRRQAPSIIGSAITFIGIFVIAGLLAKLVRYIVSASLKRSRPNMSELARKFLIVSSGRLILLLGLLYALAQLGLQIGPLLAGLGIMGFVIGFALQETLANFASGLMILIYRPYDVGDKIRVAGLEGRVREMTLVTTTIFTSANHHLTVPNNTIWKDIIHNVTSEPHVRLDLFFTAPYACDSKAILAAISEELDKSEVVEQDRDKHARVYELGESEVKYIARFWVRSSEIDEAKWSISEAVKQRFDQLGISENKKE